MQKENSLWNKLRTAAAETIKGTSVWAKIFAVLACVLFFFGIFTLGTPASAGKGVTVESKDAAIAYHLTLQSGQTVAAAYVNVGAVYVPVGGTDATDTVGIRVSYLNSSESWTNIGTTKIPSVYTSSTSSAYVSGANYNQTELFSGKSYAYEYFRLTFSSLPADAAVNEVFFVDTEGEVIKAAVFESYTEGVSLEEARKTLDAQKSFSSSDSYFYNFSQNEEYILYSIDGIGLGRTANEAYTYPASTDYNSLGILVYAFFTLIFGKSPFALRLPSFLSAFGIFLLLFFLGRKVLKGDKWGLLLSCAFLIGGAFFSLGKIGVPLAFAAFCTLAGIACTYRFYAEGIDGKRPAKSALPILFGGLFSAAAICTQTLALFPCLISLLLFVLGLIRQARFRDYCIREEEKRIGADRRLSAAPVQEENGKTEKERAFDAAAAEIQREYAQKVRFSFGYFSIALIACFILAALAELPLHGVLGRYYRESNYFTLLVRGFTQCFLVGDITAYTAGNAFTPFGWFIAAKGASVYGAGFAEGATGVTLVSMQSNLLLCALCAPALIYCTVRTATCLARGNKNRTLARGVRLYVALAAGTLLCLLPCLAVKNVSAMQSGLFQIFYGSFFVLAFYFAQGEKKKGDKGFTAVNVLFSVLFILCIVVFALSLPAAFGWTTGEVAGRVLFNWTSLWNNGRYGLISSASAQ